jgi:hypothetical protein
VTYLDRTAREIRDRVPRELLPDASGLEDLFRLYALLARVKGELVTAEDVHDAWTLWMLRQDRGHESIKPFRELDPSTRRQDAPFVAAIRAVAAAGLG